VKEFLHTVAWVTFAHASHGCIYGDDQRRETGAAGSVEGTFVRFTPTEQVKLVPDGSGGGRLHILQSVPGNGGEDIARAC
jgi:hypothetical protein